MTNYQKLIEEMTIDKMARILLDATDTSCDYCPMAKEKSNCKYVKCHTEEGWKSWLEDENVDG